MVCWEASFLVDNNFISKKCLKMISFKHKSPQNENRTKEYKLSFFKDERIKYTKHCENSQKLVLSFFNVVSKIRIFYSRL